MKFKTRLGELYRCEPEPGENEIIIPEKVTTIKYLCEAETVVIPWSVTAIKYNPFNCVKKIILDIENETYSEQNGVLYSKDGKTLVAMPGMYEDSKFYVPEGVEVIGEYAFEGARNIKEVIISSTVKTIGRNAFLNTAIENLKLPVSLISMSFQSDVINFEFEYDANVDKYIDISKIQLADYQKISIPRPYEEHLHLGLMTKDGISAGWTFVAAESDKEIAYVVLYQKENEWGLWMAKYSERPDSIVKEGIQILDGLKKISSINVNRLGKYIVQYSDQIPFETKTDFIDFVEGKCKVGSTTEKVLNAIKDTLAY